MESFSIQVILVIQVLFLPSAIGVQVPVVSSSVEQEAACPGEIITFTCTVYDSTILQWNFLGQTAKFASGDLVGKTLNRDGFTATLDTVGSSLTSSLITVFQMTYDGGGVHCTDGRETTVKTLTAAGLPSPPTGFSEENRAPMCQHTDVTFTWSPPENSGETTTMYKIAISDATYTTTRSEQSLTVSLPNGASYQAHLRASNCIGDSDPVHLNLNIVGCANPPPLERGSKRNSCTGKNSIVQYQCDPGLVLVGGSKVICMGDGIWNPNPHKLSCEVGCASPPPLERGNNCTAFCSAAFPPNAYLLVPSFQIPTDGHDGTYVCQTTEGITWLNNTEGHTAVYSCQISNGVWLNKTTTCSSSGAWSPAVECPKLELTGGCTARLAGATVSSVVATALVSMLVGCLLMWCIMGKLVQTRRPAQTTPDTERRSAVAAIASSTMPHYDDVVVREAEKFKINVNAAYVTSRQQN